jgi:hypothetical protein
MDAYAFILWYHDNTYAKRPQEYALPNPFTVTDCVNKTAPGNAVQNLFCIVLLSPLVLSALRSLLHRLSLPISRQANTKPRADLAQLRQRLPLARDARF